MTIEGCRFLMPRNILQMMTTMLSEAPHHLTIVFPFSILRFVPTMKTYGLSSLVMCIVDDCACYCIKSSKLLQCFQLSRRRIHLAELQRLSSQGIPDAGGIRATTWKVLILVNPIQLFNFHTQEACCDSVGDRSYLDFCREIEMTGRRS